MGLADHNPHVEQGDASERAFASALRFWFGTHDDDTQQLRITRTVPDNIHIDFLTDIDGNGRPETEVHILWQLKSTSSADRLTQNGLSTKLLSKHLQDMYYRSVRTSVPVILVVGWAFPKTDKSEAVERDKFDWYAIDVVQFVHLKKIDFDSCPETISICIPLCNRLNAALASLLWGSIWTAGMHRHVTASQRLVESMHSIGDSIDSSTFSKKSTLKKAARDIADALSQVPPNLQSIVATSVGINGTTLDALNKIVTARGGVYQNLATEASGPWINFWLFSRLYRRFLSHALKIQSCNHEAIRYFFPSALLQSGHHLRLAVANVIEEWCAYARFEIRLQRGAPSLEFGDVSIISRSVGLKYEFFDRRDGYIVEELSRKAAQEAYHRFQSFEAYGPAEALSLLGRGLSSRDLDLTREPPWGLLAPEDDFLEQPKNLWSRRVNVLMERP